MNSPDRDRLLELLESLPQTTPAADATERVRARCHAALGQPRQVPADRWPWIALAASLLYLAAAAAQALTILRLT
jgi:hypothetical protein